MNFSLEQVVPPYLDVLATRVPGDAASTLKRLLQDNTLLPVFQPFLGRRDCGNLPGNLIDRLPRRVVGKHGDANLCLQCVAEATERFGFGYWHRSHQAPGVNACWKHGSLLLSSCPHCSLPFQRRKRLLEAPWLPCPQCGHELERKEDPPSASKNESNYAIFVHDLLNANIAPITPELLAQLYRQRIQQIGFVWGQGNERKKEAAAVPRIGSTSMIAFTEDLIGFFGPEFIAQVDPAYAAGRTTNWLRFSMTGGVIDMPLPRHILLCMRLFGTVAHFVRAIGSTSQESSVLRVAQGRNAPEVEVEIRDQYRQRVMREIRIMPAITLEGLWRKAYRATAWLFEHDKTWLTAIVSPSDHSESALRDATPEELLRDREFAETVEKYARQLVAKRGKPLRITMQRLLDPLPLSYSHLKAHSHKFPKLSETISRNKESSWSLSARRILWAVDEVQRLGLTLTAGNVVIQTSVSYYVLNKVCEFARWDLETLARQPINIPLELARAGIGLTWQGPKSSAWAEIGGRRYVPTSTRIANKGVGLLRYIGSEPPPLPSSTSPKN